MSEHLFTAASPSAFRPDCFVVGCASASAPLPARPTTPQTDNNKASTRVAESLNAPHKRNQDGQADFLSQLGDN